MRQWGLPVLRIFLSFYRFIYTAVGMFSNASFHPLQTYPRSQAAGKELTRPLARRQVAQSPTGGVTPGNRPNPALPEWLAP